MEQRVSLITLGVRDLASSTAFYERLGWRRSMTEVAGVSFFQAGGIVIGLYPRDKLAEDAGLSDDSLANDARGFSGMALAYNTRSRDEVDTVLAEAVSAGATLLKPAAEAFWGGYSGYFADPDGFAWEVAWNPGFAIAEDGSISLPS